MLVKKILDHFLLLFFDQCFVCCGIVSISTLRLLGIHSLTFFTLLLLLLLFASFVLHLLLLIALFDLLLFGLLLQQLDLFNDLLFIINWLLLLLLLVARLRWTKRLREPLLQHVRGCCHLLSTFCRHVLFLDGLHEVLEGLLRVDLSLVFLNGLLTQERVRRLAALQLLSL